MSEINSDIIGYEWTQEDERVGRVVGPCAWSNQYVEVVVGEEKTVKLAALVRHHKRLKGVGDLR